MARDIEALTWKVLEEAAELQKVLATANQIGWDATHPRAEAPNYELAIHELDDLDEAVKGLKAAIYDYLYDMQRPPAPDLNAAAAQELGRNEGPASPPLPAEG